VKLLVIGLAAALACTGPAFAARYYLVYHGEKGTAVVDRDAIQRRAGSIFEAPLVAIRPNTAPPSADFGYAVVVTEFDCGQHEVSAGKVTLFADNGQLAQQQPPDSDKPVLWGPPPSGTAAEAALAFVCAPARQRTKLAVYLRRLTLQEIVSKARSGDDLAQASAARHRHRSR
jgi:surface-adhesin protein E